MDKAANIEALKKEHGDLYNVEVDIKRSLKEDDSEFTPDDSFGPLPIYRKPKPIERREFMKKLQVSPSKAAEWLCSVLCVWGKESLKNDEGFAMNQANGIVEVLDIRETRLKKI